MDLILPLDRGPEERFSKLLAHENIFQEYIYVIKFFIYLYIKREGEGAQEISEWLFKVERSKGGGGEKEVGVMRGFSKSWNKRGTPGKMTSGSWTKDCD